MKIYQSRAEWELDQWAKEARAKESADLAGKIEKLTDSDIAEVKAIIEGKPVDPGKVDSGDAAAIALPKP